MINLRINDYQKSKGEEPCIVGVDDSSDQWSESWFLP